MTLSRILGILALIATACTTIAGLLETIRPQWALIIAGIGVAIAAFTERVQGGVSKSDDDTIRRPIL